MPGHELQLDDSTRGRLTPRDGGLSIEVVERVDRRFLGHTEIARFGITVPAHPAGEARLEVRHTGNLRRIGVEAVVRSGDDGDRAMAARLTEDPRFAVPALALDFTRFQIERSQGHWNAVVELMGASYVSLALPPMRSYVRLHADQRDALVGALDAVAAHLSPP